MVSPRDRLSELSELIFFLYLGLFCSFRFCLLIGFLCVVFVLV